MANIYKVYKYTSPSGKIYIGQTSQTIKGRAGKKGQKYCDSPLFYNAIQKYGYDNFTVEVLKDNLTLQESNYWEKYYIEKFNSNNTQYGYNLTSGGDAKYNISDITKEKMRQSHLGLKHTQITKEKISKIHKNKKLSEETKQKITESNGKKVYCQETETIYCSAAEAARQLSISSTHVRRNCRKECDSAKGYHFYYCE